MDTTLTKTTALTGFSREAVEELSRSKGEPQWVLEARLAAWETYEQLPFPQRTDEEWRRTDLKRLKLDQQVPFAGLNGRVESLDGLLAAVEDGGISNESERAGVVVQRDASTIYTEVADDLAAEGVIYTDLDTAVREHPDLVKTYFMTQAVPANFGKFEALHAAFWQGGTFLYVPKNVTIELPFRSFVLGEEGGASLFAHSLVVLEEGAEAFFVDAFRSPSLEGAGFASEVVELVL